MKSSSIILLVLTLLNTYSFSQDQNNFFLKNNDDDNSKFTNVGNIRLTVTNFGTYGHGFSLWPGQPSCEYPAGSGIEHIFDGGLWIGGFISNDSLGTGRIGPFVSTAAVDAASVSARGGGFEFTNAVGSMIIERSSLLDSRFFDPSSVSHQDFVMDFVDTNKTLLNGELIIDHTPLGVNVHQECYAWNFPFADFFVILNYSIKNVSAKYLDSVYVGLWTDAVVRNTNITSPSGSAFFNKGGNGYSDSLKIAYEYDATGDIGFTDSYVAIQFLGSTPKGEDIFFNGTDSISTVNFVSWQFRNTEDPNFFAPQDDFQRYDKKLRGYFGGSNRYNSGINPADLKIPSNRSMLISKGAFHHIAPGDSINVVFAIVCAKKFGEDAAVFDTEEQKKFLYSNSDWALRAYYGEDRNRNGILDDGEDLNADGIITRYVLPSPPVVPKVKVIPMTNSATLYWDKSAESSIDPISGKKDFEGYRIYRTQSGFDLNLQEDILSSLSLAGEFDSTDNSVGFNTGFAMIHLDEPVTFDGDTTKYYYKFEFANLLNGWQYLFAITAFDKGDVENNLASLESSSLASLQRIIPGTPAAINDNVEIGVYPNPYYGNAIWDGNSERLRKIYFFNLPAQCEIKIYTLAGDVVKTIYHDQQSNGADLRWFETYASDDKQVMAGGEHAWDLISDTDQAVATGLYLFSVKNSLTGKIQTGKFLIVK